MPDRLRLWFIFGGDTHSLIPLFAVGVFLAFTLSQAGMVVHWTRERGRGWLFKTALNGLGTLAAAGALLIIAVSKFVEGAWFTILTILLLVAGSLQVWPHCITQHGGRHAHRPCSPGHSRR